MGVIAREKGLKRIYLPLNAPGTERALLTQELLMERAKKAFEPFTLEFEDVQWTTTYCGGFICNCSFERGFFA